MATLSDPQVFSFCNNVLRVSNNDLLGCYRTLKEFCARWTAQGLDAKIPNDGTWIIDGSESDGRPRLTGTLCHQLYGVAAEVVALFEGANAWRLTPVQATATGGEPQRFPVE